MIFSLTIDENVEKHVFKNNDDDDDGNDDNDSNDG